MHGPSPSLGLRTVRRQLAAQPAVVSSVAFAVLAASFLMSAAPRLLERVASEDLVATVTSPLPAQRNVAVERLGRLGAGSRDDPMAQVRRSGESFATAELPSAVAGIISETRFVVDSPQFTVSPMPGEEPPHPFPMFLRFRYQDGVEEHVELVAGSMPTPQEPIEVLAGEECPADPEEIAALVEQLRATGPPEDDDPDCGLEEVPHFQVAVSAETAEVMGLEVGTLTMMAPDGTDRSFLELAFADLGFRFVMSISGIVSLSDPSGEFWYGQPDLHRPRIQENADLRIIRATGLMSPADYETMVATFGAASWGYTWRYFVEPQLVERADLGVLQPELTAFEREFTTLGARPSDIGVSTQLSDLLAGHVSQRRETLAMMSLTVAGLFVVVVAVILLLAVLMTARQRSGLVLARNRGASAGQIGVTRLYEALILTVPAALAGYAASALVFGDTEADLSYRVIVALVTGVVGAMTASVLPLATARLGALQDEGRSRPRSSPRRAVVEVLAVIVSVGSILLLRRRGQLDDTNPGEIDLLLAVTPALIGVTAGLLAARLYPLLIKAMSWVAARGRGPVLFIGFRRILQQSLPARLPVLVVLVCVAVAALAAVMRSSLAEGQVVTSWQVVGADYTVEGFGRHVSLPVSVDLEALAIEETATGRTFGDARVVGTSSGVAVNVIAVDAVRYQQLTAGTPGEVEFPDAMLRPDHPAGTAEESIPALVSEQWPGEFELQVGDAATLELGSLRPVIEVVETTARYPDMPLDRPFVVLDLTDLQALSEIPLAPTIAYVRAPEHRARELRQALTEQSPSARLVSRYETLAAVTQDPFVAWAEAGLGIVMGSSALFAVVAAVSSLALSSARRRTDLAYLRTMGLQTPQATALTIIEQLPALVLATALGTLVGVGTAFALDPVVQLEQFTGGLLRADTVVDWSSVLLAGSALTGAMAASVVMFVLMSRRDDLGRILRVGGE